MKVRLAPNKGTVAQGRIKKAKQALRKHVRGKRRLVKSLEIMIKRAMRLSKSVTSPDNFKDQSKEWQFDLKWMNFNLTYFKPRPRPATIVGRLKWRREWLAGLEEIAKKAIIGQGYGLPKAEDLQAILRVFLDYSIRGRLDKTHHNYIVENPDDPAVQTILLDFVSKRLNPKEAIVAETRKETQPPARKDRSRWTRHR